jgi:hypothetical protein
MKDLIWISHGYDEWFHCLIQSIPNLKVAKDNGIDFHGITFPCDASPKMIDIFNRATKKLGWENRPILYLPHNEMRYIPRDEIVWRPSKDESLPEWLVPWLNSLYPETIDINMGESIFLSRNGYKRDNPEIERIVRHCGLGVVNLSDWDVEDQVSIIRNAKHIVGLHGSGLANLIFARPNTKVLEIIPDKEHRMYLFARLAWAAGCYYCREELY